MDIYFDEKQRPLISLPPRDPSDNTAFLVGAGIATYVETRRETQSSEACTALLECAEQLMSEEDPNVEEELDTHQTQAAMKGLNYLKTSRFEHHVSRMLGNAALSHRIRETFGLPNPAIGIPSRSLRRAARKLHNQGLASAATNGPRNW